MVLLNYKTKIFRVRHLNKQAYRKENPIDQKEIICSICGFLLDVDNGRWIDFIVKCEHLFLRNICSFEELEKTKIESEEKLSEVIDKVLEYYPIFEKALGDCDKYDEVCDRIQDFLEDFLDDVFNNPKELKDNIECKEVSNIHSLDFILTKKLFFLINCSYSYIPTLLNFVTLTRSKGYLYQENLLKT